MTSIIYLFSKVCTHDLPFINNKLITCNYFDGEWFWGNSVLPHLDNYKYLGVKFTYNGHWDTHIKDLLTAGKGKVNSLLRILNNPCLSLYAKRQVILSILRPSLEYGSEVWRCTTSQSKALDAVLLAAYKIF